MLEARSDKRHIVTTQVEHPAVLGLCQHLEKRGYRVTWLSVKQDGMLDLEELRNALTDDTALVSIMVANNETGVIFPIDKSAPSLRRRAFRSRDAVRRRGRFLSTSKTARWFALLFHHACAQGNGALYVVAVLRFCPLSSVDTRKEPAR
jgi:cysteine desulfurase